MMEHILQIRLIIQLFNEGWQKHGILWYTAYNNKQYVLSD